jgi:Zn-dependent protease with chaperone function
MRKIIITIVLLSCFAAICQTNFLAFDTISSREYRTKLSNEFKLRYKIVNSNIDLVSAKQKRIIKEIYSENQKEFLDNIDKNTFINDSKINKYLQGLLSEVLIKNKIDSKDYKILLSKDAAVNAYNVGDGILVINYGLFTVVENEDELMFVICHEIGHQYLNHVKKEIENYAIQSTSEDIAKKTSEIKKQKYLKATLANNLLNSIRYKNYKRRRQKEIEADSIGLNFYKNTLRNQKNVLGLLKKLEKSNSELDSLTIADYKLCLENGGFKLKSRYFDSEESIFQNYDYKQNGTVDSLKTHPACATRIKLLTPKLNNETIIDSKNQTFFEFKENSIYQNLINLYDNREFGICLYEALKMYKKDSENSFFKSIIYQNLLQVSLSKSNYTISRYVPDIDQKNNSKSLNTFITFINNIKISDLDIIINKFKS